MRRRAALLVAALAVLPAACGGSEEEQANEALSETASNLQEIRSATLGLRFAATAEVADEPTEVGFVLEGPIALGEEGELPVAELEFTRIAGTEETTATFVSTGEAAYVRLGETMYELPADQQDQIRAAGGQLEEQGGLGQLDVERWLQAPQLSDGSAVDGEETDRITADLDVVNLVNDLLEVGSMLGGFPAERIEGADAEQLERAVESARAEVVTGKDDRLLRRLAIDVDFGGSADVPADLRGLLRAGIELDVTLTNLNEPVEVAEPEGAQPLPAD